MIFFSFFFFWNSEWAIASYSDMLRQFQFLVQCNVTKQHANCYPKQQVLRPFSSYPGSPLVCPPKFTSYLTATPKQQVLQPFSSCLGSPSSTVRSTRPHCQNRRYSLHAPLSIMLNYIKNKVFKHKRHHHSLL